MNASTMLIVGIVSGGLPTSLTRTLKAATDCVSALSIEAPATEARTMRERLQASALSEIPAEQCKHTQIYLERKEAMWQLQFTHGSSTILRDVKSPEIAAIWVQSWLAPAASLDVPPTPVTSDKQTTSDTANSSVSTTTNTSATTRGPTSGTSLGGAVEPAAVLSAAIGSLWFGPELRYHARVARQWRLMPRLGLADAITNRPENASHALRLSVALGRDLYRAQHWLVDSAVDIGLSSMLWRDRRNAKHVAGPTAGVQVGLGYALTSSIWLVARVEAALLLADRVETTRTRVYFDNDQNDSERVDIVDSEQRFEATWVGALGLGVVFNWGDAS